MSEAGKEKSCASCGSTSGTLRRCCGNTFYCNVTCQKEHRKIHKKTCDKATFSKKTRGSGKAAVSELFAVGASQALAVDDGYDSFGEESDFDIDDYSFPSPDDCPLCMCPMPIDHRKIEFMMCCGKQLCQACSSDHATNSLERGLDEDTWTKCVFCRSKRSDSPTETVKQLKAATGRRDAPAFFLLAQAYENGQYGLPINYQKAFDMYHQSTKLGYAAASHALGCSYHKGDIVRMDKKMARRYFAKGAKGGCLGSLHMLGVMRFKDEDVNLDFLTYFVAAAELGWKDSIDSIKNLHGIGLVSKEDYKLALTSYLGALKKEQSASRDKVVAKINKERAQRNERPIG